VLDGIRHTEGIEDVFGIRCPIVDSGGVRSAVVMAGRADRDTQVGMVQPQAQGAVLRRAQNPETVVGFDVLSVVPAVAAGAPEPVAGVAGAPHGQWIVAARTCVAQIAVSGDRIRIAGVEGVQGVGFSAPKTGVASRAVAIVVVGDGIIVTLVRAGVRRPEGYGHCGYQHDHETTEQRREGLQ
jgi:hypothetical protein